MQMIEKPKNISPSEIDTIDRNILRRIQDNGRITNAELAEQVGLSAAACHKRVKRLDTLGVIQAYTAIIDPRAAGYTQSAFVHITLHTQGSDTIEAFERAVTDSPQIIECHLMTGDYDYLLHVIIRDAQEYEQLHRDILTKLPGVARLTSSFALRTVRRTSKIPIPSI
jgi:DNA-binding Lrp family transcriptional regulator